MTHYNKKPSDPVRYRPEDPNCYTYVDGYGFAPPPPVITERRMLQFYSNGLGFAILLYFLMAASVPFGVLRLFSLIWPVIRVYGNQVVASSSIIQLVNIFSSTICMLVPFLLFMLLCRVPARVAFPMKRFSPSLCVPCIFVAMGVSVIGLASSSLLGRFLELFGLQPHVAISIPQNPLALLLFAVQLCVLTPLVEEVVFRGIIFQSMRRFGDSFALVLSAILFALFHGNLSQAPNAFLMGLVIGYLVLYSGSLWVGIIIHAVNNLLNLAADLLLQTIPEPYQTLVWLAILSFYLIAGTTAMLVLVRAYPNLFMFIRSTTLSTERIKYRVTFSAVTMVIALTLLVLLILQNML